MRTKTIEAGWASGAVSERSLAEIAVDTTVMEKAIAHRTDSRLYEKARHPLVALAHRAGTGRHTEPHSAFRNATARIEYPWHPLRGQSLRVVQRLTKGGLDILWLEERPGRSRMVPA
jgi:IS5 family transposase